MIYLVIAEKPSVARDIASVLENKEFKDGYITGKLNGDTYYVTWAIGHLLELAEPHYYDEKYRKWSLENLPILPDRFLLIPKKNTKNQLQVIKNLFQQIKPDIVVNAGDADREGQLLVEEILEYVGWKGPVKRFWTSEALTPNVVKRELKQLKDNKDFQGYFLEARARQQADWLIGINLTRALTCISSQGRSGVWSVGRVQTAILSILADREERIQKFKPTPYWTVSADRFWLVKTRPEFKALSIGEEVAPEEVQEEEEKGEGKGNSDGKTGGQNTEPFRFAKKQDAEAVKQEVERVGILKVLSVVVKRKQEKPPGLFSLTRLQREANKLFGFSAQKTLSLAQSLYEKHKVQSYPRTSCEYMAHSNQGLLEKVLKELGIKDAKDRLKKSKIFNDRKVAGAGHHAIIPLRTVSVSKEPLSKDEEKIFDLVKRRLLAAIDEPHVYEEVQVKLQCGDHEFFAAFRKTITPGWRKYYPPNWKPYNQEINLREGEEISVKEVIAHEGKTKPPPRFTEAGLLTLMKQAWRFVSDPELKQKLKMSEGIGTEATRAQIIETLKQRNYITLKGKQVRVTQKGMILAKLAKQLNLSIAKVELTGLWEKALHDIRKGKFSFPSFVEKSKKMTQTELQRIIQNKELISKEAQKTALTCPSCQSLLTVNRGGAFCSKCNFKLFRKVLNKSLTDNQIEKLIKGDKVFIKNMKSKAGKVFSAYLYLDKNEIRFRFVNNGNRTSKKKEFTKEKKIKARKQGGRNEKLKCPTSYIQ